MSVGDETPVIAGRGGSSIPRSEWWWREGAVVAAGFWICLLGGFLHINDTVAPPPAATYVLAGVSCALLLARHRAPVTTMLATTACGMLVAPLGLLLTPLIIAPAVISAYSLAFRSDRRTLGAVLSSSVLLVGIAPLSETGVSWEDASRLVTVAASLLVAATLGRSARHRRAYLEVMEERARRAEDERDSQARQQVAEERIRIARELHDLVAHQITLANAQATVAAHLFDTKPEQSRENLVALVKTTRQALNELRATVGLLRQYDEASATTVPAPGLRQLVTLLETFHSAGLAVSLREDGIARPLSPAMDLTAFRIIQESLTNVTKHAATARAQVHLSWHDEHLGITVTDDGTGPRTSSEHVDGFGLIGLQERVSAVGGIFKAGARPDGGFLVSSQLSLPTSSEN